MYYYIKFNRTPKKTETFSLASGFKFVKANSESEAKNKLKKWVFANYPNTAQVEFTTVLEAGNERQNGGSWSSSNILDEKVKTQDKIPFKVFVPYRDKKTGGISNKGKTFFMLANSVGEARQRGINFIEKNFNRDDFVFTGAKLIHIRNYNEVKQAQKTLKTIGDSEPLKYVFSVGYAGKKSEKIEIVATNKEAAFEKIKRRIKFKLGEVEFPAAGNHTNGKNGYVKDKNGNNFYYTLTFIKTRDEAKTQDYSRAGQAWARIMNENSKKIYNIAVSLKGGGKMRNFIAIGTNENDAKNKVKRLLPANLKYDFIVSKNNFISIERFNKLAGGKEVIRNELKDTAKKIGDSEKQFIPPLTKFKEILKSATGDNKKFKWRINSNAMGYFTARGDKISFIAKSNDNAGTGWAVGKVTELEKIYTRFKTQILPYN